MVEEIRVEAGSDNLMPARGAELLKSLASLFGNITQEIRKRDMEYKLVLLRSLESEEKANRAKIKAEVSPEYQLMREARDIKELALEIIRSLKYFLRAWEEERKVSGNM